MAVVEHLKAYLEGAGQLFEQHVTLARLELKEDARVMGGQLTRIALFAVLLLVGYGFLCAAGAAYLTRYVERDAALAIVGLTNLLAGVVGVIIAGQRLKGRAPMKQTLLQADRTVQALQGKAPSGAPHVQ